MQERTIDFSFRARYYQLGALDASTRQVWIVFHGYGQLAQFFIKKFESLLAHDICIIAPEGLSRFYLSELTEQGRKDNKVGATWMTRENRLVDIENYIHYLDAVAEQVPQLTRQPVTLLGFSQGCATVCRWASQGKIPFDRLILWAGLFPPDMDFESGHRVLSSKKTCLVAGDQDPFVTAERILEFDALATRLGIHPEKIIFRGKHEIQAEVLNQLISP
jgi:predicted esterase